MDYNNSHVFHNGLVATQDVERPYARVLAFEKGKIWDASDYQSARQLFRDEAIYHSLGDKVILPTFNDAHIHIWKVGDLLTYMLDLRGVKSIAEMQDKIADFARRNPDNEWILARGFNEANFPEGQMPTRYDLDKVLKDKPLHVIRTCAHIAVLNTKALEICQITKQTPVPAGGEIRLDDKGEPNGILSETALGLAKRKIPEYSAAQYRRMILAAQDEFLKYGIGSATDPAVHPELMDVYKAMDEAGELKIRINAIPIMIPDGANQALPLPQHYESNYLKVNTVKFFSDGGLSGKTAAIKHFYKNSNEQGVLRLDYDFFKKTALEAQKAGFQIATHAIGDAAIDLVLKVYEDISTVNKQGIKHRIEHLCLPELSHLYRMKELGVSSVTQPVFLYELGQNYRNYLPDYYLENVLPFRSMIDSGINVAFSSDAPVVKNYNPWVGIQAAVTRKDAQGEDIAKHQKISVLEAVSAYTLGGSLAQNDQQNGALKVRNNADFIIIDKNPYEIPAENLSEIKVLETWVGGERKF
jgi:predicted amidohydrolase YtcJ